MPPVIDAHCLSWLREVGHRTMGSSSLEEKQLTFLDQKISFASLPLTRRTIDGKALSHWDVEMRRVIHGDIYSVTGKFCPV